MRIKALKIKSFKRIGEVDIEAGDRQLLIIGGRNAQGKSSVLDAITAALVGEKAVPAQPIKVGEDKAEVTVDLGDVVVTRTFKRTADGGTYNTALKIVTADGMRPAAAQTWLNSKMGDLSCDPVAFLHAEPKAQAERLRKLAGVDTSKIDSTRKDVFETRTSVNRELKAAEAAYDNMPLNLAAGFEEQVPVMVEPEVVSAAQISEELSKAMATARVADEAQRKVDDAERLLVDLYDTRVKVETEIEELEKRIAGLRERAAGYTSRIQKGEAVVVELKAAAEEAKDKVVPVEPIQKLLADVDRVNQEARAAAAAQNAKLSAQANERNAQVRANLRRREKGEEVAKLKAETEKLTERLRQLDNERAELIASAAFPVPGLGFDEEGGVTLNGLPLAQASQAEKVRVSMGIALAANPTVRIVLIRDASLLDEDSLKLVVELAEKADAQVWLERVGTADEGAIVIEDGGVHQ